MQAPGHKIHLRTKTLLDNFHHLNDTGVGTSGNYCQSQSTADYQRLLDKKVLMDFARPFDLVWKYKGLGEGATSVDKGHALSETGKNRLSLIWSGTLCVSRTAYLHDRGNSIITTGSRQIKLLP